MNDENQNTGTPERDDDVILPEGYNGENIFDEPDPDDENIFGKDDTLEGFGGEDEDKGDPAPEEEAQPKNETSVSDGGGEGSAPAAAQEQEAERRLRFKYGDQDIDLPEGDIPGIYGKAQEHAGISTRLQELQADRDEANNMAKRLGFKDFKDMLAQAQDNYRDAEVKRLTEDPEHPVHPEVARDIVERRMRENAAKAPAAQQEQPAQANAATAQQRDFRQEMNDLLADYPKLREELSKGGILPQEVVTNAAKTGITLREAYANYEAQEVKREEERVEKEKAIQKQNAEAKAKAPVKGTAGTGPVNTKDKDPFLEGFLSDN